MSEVTGFRLAVDAADRAAEPVVTSTDAAITVTLPKSISYHHPIRITIERSGLSITVNAGERANGILLIDATASHRITINLEREAKIECISRQLAEPTVQLSISQSSTVGDDASIAWRNITLGGASVEHDLRSELTGKNATSDIAWMFYAKGDEKYRLSARNVFTQRDGGGEITVKGVAEQRAHVRCDGLIDIGVHGGGTNTYLTENVLMLDSTAKVDAIPGLEIKTNDVKASHSAAVSRVTDADLFYFAARGIPEKEAKRMFVEGFLGDLLAHVPIPAVREEVGLAIEAKYVR